MKEKEEKKLSLIQKIRLSFRKNIAVSRLRIVILIGLLVAGFICLNLYIQKLSLPMFDITTNKIHTLSTSSKDVIEKIDKDVNIVTYGFPTKSSEMRLIEQYVKANPEHITHEILTDSSDPVKVQSYGLTDGYEVVIFECEGKTKMISSNDFTTIDYTDFSLIDRTEQVLTNGLISISLHENNKVNFLINHGEYNEDQLKIVLSYLQAEAFSYEFVDLIKEGTELNPKEILCIINPKTDITEAEANKIIDFVNKGGNIFYAQGYYETAMNMPNMQKVLDIYEVHLDNGFIIENDESRIASDKSLVFFPNISTTSTITSDIATYNSYVILEQAGKIRFNDVDFKDASVSYQELLYTSDKAGFTSTIDSTAKDQMQSGKFIIGALVRKVLNGVDYSFVYDDTEIPEDVQSKLIIVASSSFLEYDSKASAQLSTMGSNIDFVMNSISELADKSNYIRIRSVMDNAQYTPTAFQDKIVKITIFAIPTLIILTGLVVKSRRNRRK